VLGFPIPLLVWREAGDDKIKERKEKREVLKRDAQRSKKRFNEPFDPGRRIWEGGGGGKEVDSPWARREREGEKKEEGCI